MTFTTRYNINDRVWFLDNNRVRESRVSGIRVGQGSNWDAGGNNRVPAGTLVSYSLTSDDATHYEPDVFPSKKELLESL